MTRVNNLHDLADFFSTEEKPVGREELFDFWYSLSVKEMYYYMSVDLER